MEECPICYDELSETTVTLTCNHKFHKECMNKAIYYFNEDGIDIIQFKRCPCCRKDLNNVDKTNIIAGKQFTQLIMNETDNYQIVDAYQQIVEIEYNGIDTGITPTEVFERLVDWRDGSLEELKNSITKLDYIYDNIIDCNILIRTCKLHFAL